MYSKQICRDILFALPALSCHELNFSKVRAGSGELVSVRFMPLQRRCWTHGHLTNGRALVDTGRGLDATKPRPCMKSGEVKRGGANCSRGW